MHAQQKQSLVQAALDIQRNAYCRYSKFPVGAALLGKSGHIYCGVNVENVSSGLTICAERNAITTAVTAGETEFTAIAIALRGGGSPCGACRQVLVEFCDDVPVWMVDSENPNHVTESTLGSLLPMAFSPRSLKH